MRRDYKTCSIVSFVFFVFLFMTVSAPVFAASNKHHESGKTEMKNSAKGNVKVIQQNNSKSSQSNNGKNSSKKTMNSKSKVASKNNDKNDKNYVYPGDSKQEKQKKRK